MFADDEKLGISLEEIREHAEFLSVAYVEFVEEYKLDESEIQLNNTILAEVSYRFLRDLRKIVISHEIDKADNAKRAGFVTYWINRLKPIAWFNIVTKRDVELYMHVNELFAMFVAGGVLFSEKKDREKTLNFDSFGKYFRSHFLYTLRHRTTSGYNLTLMYYLMGDVLELKCDKKKLEESILLKMADFIEKKDNFTGGHIKRIGQYMKILLDELVKDGNYKNHLDRHDINDIILASGAHDFGKIAIPSEILNKPKKLSDEEIVEMRKHPCEGARLIAFLDGTRADSKLLEPACIMAESHHEAWDGSGYPKGLAKEDIPLLGRIMAIVDVYDALAFERPYKKALPHKKVSEIITNDSGKRFDPAIVEVFIKVADKFKAVVDDFNK